MTESGHRHLVFVYGTLKRGFPNHAHMDGQTFLALARTIKAYPLVIQGTWFSPAMLPEPGSGLRVVGELWSVDDAGLERLDRLEGVGLPFGYTREEILLVRLDSGAELKATVYFKPRERVTVVHSEPLADYQDRRYVPAALRPAGAR